MGTLGAKAAMGYLLGLFSEASMKELETFGLIRNRFAHFHKPLDFTDHNIRDWVKSLRTPKRIGLDGGPVHGQWDRNAIRFHFMWSLEIYVAILDQLAEGYRGPNPLDRS